VTESTPEKLRRDAREVGLVNGRPVRTDPEATRTETPPLRRPAIEVLVETIRLLGPGCGPAGDEVFRATLASSEVRVGEVTVALASLCGVASVKDEAVRKLCDLVGQAVSQVYVHWIASDDPNEVEAARSMDQEGLP
jgi:hypothetical protein